MNAPAFAHIPNPDSVFSLTEPEVVLARRHLESLPASRRAELDDEWSPTPLTLTEALRPRFGLKAEALAEAHRRFDEHRNRARFESEVRRIKSCALADLPATIDAGEGDHG